MKKKIKIDIVSDVVCPWCTIGYKRLEKAISELGVEDQVDIEWQPFELNPNMPEEGQDIVEHITEKYGSTVEQQKESHERMAALAQELGFTFDIFDGMRIVNTRDAHVLLEYAHEKGKQTELKMRLMTAYFSERKDVSEREVLLKEVENVGLNVDEARTLLENDDSRKEVKAKEEYWQSLGVTAVPTIVFNKESALTGAQPVDTYKEVLTELLA